MDEETCVALKTITEGHDALVLKFAGLLSVVGALVEKYPVERDRVDAWCREISGLSESVGQTATQRHAHDILRGIEPA